MTEHQAWKALAVAFSTLSGDGEAIGGKDTNLHGWYGLCAAIGFWPAIGVVTMESMLKKVDAARKAKRWAWPVGSPKRAAFCRHMAAKTKPKART